MCWYAAKEINGGKYFFNSEIAENCLSKLSLHGAT